MRSFARPRIHRTTVAAAVVALTLVTAACSAAGPAPSASPADASLSAVQDSGTLVVATEGTYRPFSFHDAGTGELTGYDVEVARAVAERLGVRVTFEETQWDGIFAGLDAGRFDMIANQVSITPEREKTYDFSTPYTTSTGAIVVRSDDTSISSFADLDGKRTAQSLTSNWYDLAESSGAQIEPIEGWAQAVALVEQGRVDATINDTLTFLDYQQHTGDTGLRIAARTTDTSTSAFAFRQGSTALANTVDDALESLRADGTLARISTTYFGEDVSG